jgi:ring-1,2-phenylacetyl-CoA epoxidase subunit PaaB
MMTKTDTQLPRYQVFLQEKSGAPHQDVGSVHAADPEMALQNARDVFVRRPECVNLWVVPANKIYAKTEQELQAEMHSTNQRDGVKTTVFGTYCVFVKQKSAGTRTFIGEIQASDPVEAIQRAREQFLMGSNPFAWLVFPKDLIVESEENDLESMFTPAREKSFRMATDFHTLTEMRKILAQKKQQED